MHSGMLSGPFSVTGTLFSYWLQGLDDWPRTDIIPPMNSAV